jgi:purine-nucleoside phosphorylase
MKETIEYLRARLPETFSTAIVLGSGLGPLAGEVEEPITIPYAEIPGWPRSTAIGHAGKLVFGKLAGCPVAVMSGRAHFYEGYPMEKVVWGVRVLAHLGARQFILTNAAGGIQLRYSQGALVLITDHINLQGTNPLIGPNDDALGPRFPDMTYAYSPRLRQTALSCAAKLAIPLEQGVYAALSGPAYETPAEIRYLRAIGADLVGMSTVPETIALNHMGREVLGISCVTNMAAGILDQAINHEEVLETGRQVRERFSALVKEIVKAI